MGGRDCIAVLNTKIKKLRGTLNPSFFIYDESMIGWNSLSYPAKSAMNE